MFFISLLVGCAVDKQSEQWSSAEDCLSLPIGSSKDNCLSRYIVDIFKADPGNGIAVVKNQISEQSIRDFIWLKITREYNPATREYCDLIVDHILQKRCHSLSSRPHLHRDILREK